MVAGGAEGAEMEEAIEPEAESTSAAASTAADATVVVVVAAAAAVFAASTARPTVSGRGSSARLPNTAPAAATRQGSKYLRAKQ